MEDQEAVLHKLLSKDNNFDNAQVAKFYNMVAEPLGWDTITAATVGIRRNEVKLLIDAGRRGLTDFRNQHTMQVKRSAPNTALYYWTLDGWDVELLYQATSVNKDGHSVTTYSNRLCLVLVLDAAGKYPVGYAIGERETPALIRLAMRNAMDHVKELFGESYKPLQLQSDHYGRGTLNEVYEGCADKYTPARVKNAKAKIIEPFFKWINKTYCQLLYNWSGFGVTSKKDSQPNDEFKGKIKKDFPDELGCRRQIEAIVADIRKNALPKYLEAYKRLDDTKKTAFTQEQYLYLFGHSTGHTNRLEPSGVHISIDGQKVTYDSFDLDFRMQHNCDWKVLYNPDDLQTVLAVNKEGTKRFLLEKKYIQPMALADRKEGDGAELQRVNNFNAHLENKVVDFNGHNYEKVNEVMADERLNDTLAKMLLTDSRGQHKDRRNDLAKPVEKLKIKEAKQEVKMVEQVKKTFLEEEADYLAKKVDLSKY
jgi:hypothetical protein